MTHQRWWNARKLARIRLGVLMGKYHQSAHFIARYTEILHASDQRELGLYERGLLRGYESAVRIGAGPKFTRGQC